MSNVIVVGVDGSEPAARALAWAVEEARLRGATLELVNVYENPQIPEFSSPSDLYSILERPRELAEQVLAKTLESIDDDVEARGEAVQSSNAAHALVERSKDALMLVVGERGNGPFRRLVLGSVSTAVAHHAECPVVIIPVS